MNVTLLVHLEAVESGLVWWAESPEVPGFSVTSTTLRELQVRAKMAMADIAEDEGWVLDGIRAELVEEPPSTGNPADATVTDAAADHTAGAKGRVVVGTLCAA